MAADYARAGHRAGPNTLAIAQVAGVAERCDAGLNVLAASARVLEAATHLRYQYVFVAPVGRVSLCCAHVLDGILGVSATPRIPLILESVPRIVHESIGATNVAVTRLVGFTGRVVWV